MNIKRFAQLNESHVPSNHSLEDLYRVYQIEGHGYAVEDHTGTIRCEEDFEAERLWNQAALALEQLTAYFAKKVADGTLEFFEY